MGMICKAFKRVEMAEKGNLFIIPRCGEGLVGGLTLKLEPYGVLTLCVQLRTIRSE
jgi:hypothetical protein